MRYGCILLKEDAMGQIIQLTASDGHKLNAYCAEPEGEPRGGVVVVQEIFGVNIHIREVTDSYAREGYLAIAPAIFDRFEVGVELGYEPDDIAIGQKLKVKGNENLDNGTNLTAHSSNIDCIIITSSYWYSNRESNDTR